MRKRRKTAADFIAPASAIAVAAAIWFFVSGSELVPAYMLPSPVEVASAFLKNLPVMLEQAAVTLQETLWGLLAGVALSFVFSVLMDAVPFLYKALYPLLVVSQTVPTVAIAPLLVLWFGFGMAPKIVLVILTTFFPITVALLGGFREADEDAIRLMRTMGASKPQIFRYVKLPGAVPGFFSGLRISASYSVIGAVVAEWLGGLEGLGVYMTRVRKAYAFDKMFAVIVFISLLSLLLMALVAMLEYLAMPYKRARK
ncbi:MAG: ABC transporter permease [Clostridia bacterium]|nr:ABC transporter permease [Clostridia bacterium]